MKEGIPGQDQIKEAYHDSLNRAYDSIHQGGLEAIERTGIVPVEINPLTDTRSSLDLYFLPPQDLKDSVEQEILKPLWRLFVNLGSPQAVYDPSWLHLSVFIIINAEAPEEEKPRYDTLPLYLKAVEETLFSAKPVEVSFSRLCLTPQGLILGGIPEDQRIQEMRKELSRNLEKLGLPSIQRRPSFITHLTVARWSDYLPASKADKIIDFVNRKNGIEIWRGTLDHVRFGIGTYVMDPERVVTLKEFKLR